MACNCRAYLAKAWHVVCLLTVEPALFLVALGSAISDTATRVLMYDKVCIMVLGEVDRCVARNFSSEEAIVVEKEASLWEFYRTLTSNLPAVFLIVIYSNLVDRWSKKYTMFFTPVGYILSMVVYLVCSIYLESSPGYMLLGSTALGLSGGILAMMGACFSYLSATASPGMLVIHISMAEASLLASAAISSFASGVLLDAVGYIWVYIIGIVINVVLCLYVLVRIKNIPLSASVLAQAAAEAANDSSAAKANSEEPLKKAGTVKRKVDDGGELTIQMEGVSELELSGQLNKTCVDENGSKPDEKLANYRVEDTTGTKRSRLENGHLPQEDDTVDVRTSAENGTKIVSVPMSAFHDNLPNPLQSSPNGTVQLGVQRTPFDGSSSAAGSSPVKSTAARDPCAFCVRAARTIWFYARIYVNTAIKRRENNKRKGIIAILCIIIIEVICTYATGIGLCYLFVSQEPLSWSSATYGYYTGAMRGVKGLCLLVVVPLFKRMNVQYTKVIIISLVSSIISNTIFGLSLYTWMAFFSAMLSLFQTALIVTARSSIVNFVDLEEHGKAFGMIASLESLGFILSSVIFNIIIYPATVHIFSGLAIVIAALILLFPLAIAIWLHVFTRNMSRMQVQVITQTIN